MNKLIFIPLIIVVIGLGIYAFILFGSSLCDNEYESKVFAPGNEYFVQVLISSCGGAAGDITTNAVLNKADERYLFFFGYNRANILAIDGGSIIKPMWLDNRTLKLAYSNCEKVYSKDQSWKDVKIIHECS